jgi:hypothetical protein
MDRAVSARRQERADSAERDTVSLTLMSTVVGLRRGGRHVDRDHLQDRHDAA